MVLGPDQEYPVSHGGVVDRLKAFAAVQEQLQAH
jgi:hypothetical protein